MVRLNRSYPSLNELERRLKNRSTDSDEVIKNRLKMAKEEVKRVDEYDYLIINDKLDDAVKEFVDIIKLNSTDPKAQ